MTTCEAHSSLSFPSVCRKGNLSKVRHVLSKHPQHMEELLTQTDENGETALMAALFNNHYDIVRYICLIQDQHAEAMVQNKTLITNPIRFNIGGRKIKSKDSITHSLQSHPPKTTVSCELFHKVLIYTDLWNHEIRNYVEEKERTNHGALWMVNKLCQASCLSQVSKINYRFSDYEIMHQKPKVYFVMPTILPALKHIEIAIENESHVKGITIHIKSESAISCSIENIQVVRYIVEQSFHRETFDEISYRILNTVAQENNLRIDMCLHLTFQSFEPFEAYSSLCSSVQIKFVRFQHGVSTIPILHSVESMVLGSVSCADSIFALEKYSKLKKLTLCSTKLEQLPKCKFVEDLDAANCGNIKKFKDLEEYTQLKKLRLTSCNVVELPNCPTVELLDLSKCMTVKNFDMIKNYKNLKDLSLSFTKIETLPECPTVVKLDLSYCMQLQHFDGLKFYPQLKVLKLKGTKINRIPIALNLEEINLEGCSDISDFSDLSKLSKLQHLNLANTKTDKIPLCLGLTYINLTNCRSLVQFELLESFLQLEVLIADETKLNIIPQCQNLQVFSCTHCTKIENFEVLERLIYLKELNLSSSNLVEIPFCPNATTLHLDFCDICNLKVLELFPILENLSLKGAKIQSIPVCPSVVELDMSFTKVVDFEPLAQYPRLTSLNISSSRNLIDIPFCVNLETLNLRSCKRVKDFDTLSGFMELKSLNIGNTKIAKLPTCSSVEYLVLRNCKEISDILALKHYKNIKKLVLTGSVNNSGLTQANVEQLIPRKARIIV